MPDNGIRGCARRGTGGSKKIAIPARHGHLFVEARRQMATREKRVGTVRAKNRWSSGSRGPVMGSLMLNIYCALYFSCKQHEIVARRLTVELENEELLSRSLETNSSLSHSNNELQTRTEMEQRAKLAAKSRADQLGAHISRTLLPIAECDRNLNVIEWNAAAEATLGYRHKDVRGQHLTSLLLPAENQLAGKPAIEKLLREDCATSIDIPLQTSRGQRIPMQLFFTPIQAAEGFPARIAVIMTKA